MNCKNCIHFNVCEKAKHPENYAMPLCKDFKDKESFAEVVRCKDCMWYLPIGGGIRYRGKLAKFCFKQNRVSYRMGFCSEGISEEGKEIGKSNN